ncbi:MAG TPA: DUF4384 domain-containing protein [Kofleriaceae bacterium]|nr:DUF4384 domain-containing protein [Kofleriaceae bacterium]
MTACATAVRPPPSSSGDDERGINLEATPELLGFDHSIQVRESRVGVPHELRDGDTLKAGDRIRVHVQTSVDAYLYLVYCSKQGVTLYPAEGVIRALAGVVTALPTGSVELEVDNEPGTEILYVVASTAELAAADPKLAAALTARMRARTAQDCGPSLDAAFVATSGATSAARPLPAPAAQPPPAPAARPPARTPTTIRGKSVAPRSLPAPAQPRPPLSPPPPDPDFVRNPGAIADSTGIAVVRHEFIHVAR